ncbi:MAG: 16S rRNA (uracil(1498)-N(3))-methyltransferase [Pseudomonadota bacterium]
MARGHPKIRLFVEDALTAGASVAPSRDQVHYLSAVMRQGPGGEVLLFNGRDGEWLAEIELIGKRSAVLICRVQERPQSKPPDIWLAFAPIKKARTDFIAEKATEMGVRRILPVTTRRTNSDRVREDRLRAHAVEAAEQCGLLAVPQVDPVIRLEKLLDDWNPARRIMFCDETGDHGAAADTLRAAEDGPWAVLIGPEGGFDAGEVSRLRALPFSVPVSLGPRILRADTAAVAALSLWQSTLGDWR